MDAYKSTHKYVYGGRYMCIHRYARVCAACIDPSVWAFVHIRAYIHCVHIIHIYVYIYLRTSVQHNLSVDMRACTHAHAGTWIPHRHSYICIRTSRRRGTHSFFRLGQSTAAGSAASSVFDASLKPNTVNIRLSTHAQAQTHICRNVHIYSERQLRWTYIQMNLYYVQRYPALDPRRGSAAPAPPRRRLSGGRDAQGLQELALAERLGERLHLRGVDVPASHGVRVRLRPPRDNGQPWGRTGRNHAKEVMHAGTHTRMRMIGTPMHSERRWYPKADAPQRAHPRAQSPQPHALTRVSMPLRSFMYLKMVGCPHTHTLDERMARDTRAPIDARGICLGTHTIDARVRNVSAHTHVHAYMHTYEFIIDI
jgi:hypothetical protein